MKTRCIVALSLFSIVAAGLPAQSLRTVQIRGGPKIDILVPMGYSFESSVGPDNSVRVTLENPVWGIGIAVLMAAERDRAVTDRQWQENKLIGFIGDALSISKENDYNFQPLLPVSGTGIFCQFTASNPDDIPSEGTDVVGGTHLTAGIKAWRGFVLIFRMTSNDLTSDEYREALEILRSSFTAS